MFEKFHRFHLSQCLLCFLTVCLILSFFSPASAHPGGTDEYGGHYNRSTGTYHFHHGYPAHQHTGGVCPYDFDDQTGEQSGSSSSSAPSETISRPDPSQNPSSSSTSSASSASSSSQDWTKIFLILLFPPVTYALICVLRFLFLPLSARRRKNREIKQRQQQDDLRRQKLLAQYEGKRLSQLVPPPGSGDHIGSDGLPCGLGSEKWGKGYTVYLTSSKSKVYHKVPFCSASYGYPVNLAKTGCRCPCSKCFRSPPPDLTWYEKQREIIHICNLYQISLAPEDFHDD